MYWINKIIKNIKNYRHKFLKLSTIIVVFVIAVTAANTLLSTQLSSRIIKGEFSKNNAMLVNKIKILIENKIFEMDRTIIRFCIYTIDEDDIKNEFNSAYNRYLLYKKFERLGVSNDYIHSIYIFFDNGTRVYSYNYTAKKYSIGDTKEFSATEAYNELIKSSDFSNIRSNNNLISIAKRLPLTKVNSKNAIVVNIKEKYLVELISDNYIIQNSGLYIFDGNNRVLASTSNLKNSFHFRDNFDISSVIEHVNWNKVSNHLEKMRIDGDIYYLTAEDTDEGNRKYLMVTPRKELLNPVRDVNIPVYVLSNLILFIAIIFAKYVEGFSLRPISKLIKTIKSKVYENVIDEKGSWECSPSKGNEMNQLEGMIDNIISVNKEHEKQIKDYFNYYKERMLLSLMIGDLHDSSEESFENRVFQKSEYKGYVVLQIYVKNSGISHESELESNLNSFMENIRKNLAHFGKVEIIRINRYRYAILICLNIETSDMSTEEDIEEILLSSLDDKRCLFITGIGNLCYELDDIKVSFAQSQKAIQYLEEINGRHVMKYKDITEETMNEFIYPTDVEKRVNASFLSGDPDKTELLIKMFIEDMKAKRVYIEKAKKYTMMLIFNINQKLDDEHINIDRITQTEVIEQIDMLKSYIELEEWLNGLIKTINSENSRFPKINNNELVETVCKYIDNNYGEDICLYSVAERVYLSPSYFGRMFKEHTGNTFIEYLINVRMMKAAQLLTKTEMNISKIIREVGYHSSQSFNKIFRSRYGYNPSDYRKKYAVDSLNTQS
jgi:two-component system, response regulator YesN